MGKTRDLFRRRQWHPTPVLLPGKSHGQRSLVGGSPWGRTESDTTEVTWQQQQQALVHNVTNAGHKASENFYLVSARFCSLGF